MKIAYLKSVSVCLLLVYATLSYSQPNVVRLGQIVPLSGGLANVGKEINDVTLAAIAKHNAQSKLKIELLTEDDGNQPERSAAAVAALSNRAIGFVSCFGTVSCLAQMKATQDLNLPLIGPIAGAAPLRDKQAKHVFAVRASAADELNRLVKFAQIVGFNQLAVAVQDDGFGQAYQKALAVALEGSGIQIKEVVFKPQTPNYDAIGKALQKSPTNATLLLANASHSVGILKSMNKQGTYPFILNLPGQANSLFANGMKQHKGGVAFATVTHSPWDTKLQIQRDYHDAMAAANISNYSYLGFEAYMNARLAIEAIVQSRQASASALLGTLDVGKFSISGWTWRKADPLTSRFTDLATLSKDGTYKH
jgi:ABC-type branched-subunit amino acid transport system substrate-binding protein